MIYYVKGNFVEKTATNVIVDCAGIGYDVQISLNTYADIEPLAEGLLFTYHLVREIQLDSFTLIGHSMGGYVSLELLGLCANSIKHICLMHSTALADTEEKKLNRTRAIQMLRDKKLISKYCCYIIFVEFIDFTAESAIHLKRTALLFDDV